MYMVHGDDDELIESYQQQAHLEDKAGGIGAALGFAVLATRGAAAKYLPQAVGWAARNPGKVYFGGSVVLGAVDPHPAGFSPADAPGPVDDVTRLVTAPAKKAVGRGLQAIYKKAADVVERKAETGGSGGLIDKLGKKLFPHAEELGERLTGRATASASGAGDAADDGATALTESGTAAARARLPSADAGTWKGRRGHGVFTPKGTNVKIPFRNDRPDFSSVVKQGHSFRRVKGLVGDPKADANVMLDHLKETFGFTSRDAVREWLGKQKTPYGVGLRMHHSGSGAFQLVPREIHEAVAHGGFPGSAAALRRGN